MKKILFLVTAIVLCVAVFAACGTEAAPAGDAGEQAAEIPAGETYDAGNITIDVPDGWLAVPVYDMFAEEEGATDPNAVQVIKGGESEFDVFTKPYMQINYYDPDVTTMMTPDPTWYDDVVEFDPIEIGARTWEGFSGKSLELPVATIWTVDGDGNQLQILLWTEVDGQKISLDDADVKAIIESIGVK